jgi:hypothetical protein
MRSPAAESLTWRPTKTQNSPHHRRPPPHGLHIPRTQSPPHLHRNGIDTTLLSALHLSRREARSQGVESRRHDVWKGASVCLLEDRACAWMGALGPMRLGRPCLKRYQVVACGKANREHEKLYANFMSWVDLVNHRTFLYVHACPCRALVWALLPVLNVRCCLRYVSFSEQSLWRCQARPSPFAACLHGVYPAFARFSTARSLLRRSRG